MAKHSLRIDYDEESGEVRLTHRCSVSIAGQTVSHSEEIPVGSDSVATLKTIIESNRKNMEHRTTGMAIQHVAAVMKTPQAGVKQLQISGSLGALGASKSDVVTERKVK